MRGPPLLPMGTQNGVRAKLPTSGRAAPTTVAELQTRQLWEITRQFEVCERVCVAEPIGVAVETTHENASVAARQAAPLAGR